MHCLAGSLLWQEILGDHFFKKKTCLSQKNTWHFFCKKSCLSAVPKRIRSLIEPLFKNSFSTHFQGTGPWEGPVHFSRFVLRVHSCSKLFQSWSWSQEKQETPFSKASGLSLSRSLFLSLSLPLRLPLPLPLSLSLSLSLVPFLFFFLCLLSQVSLSSVSYHKFHSEKT